jgi:membrane protease YdiL (CAAX protease family)
MTRTRTRSLVLLLCLAAVPAVGQAPIDIERDFAPGTHTRFAERVNKGQTSIYADVLAAYDARLASHPDDVISNIERCRFIETFAYSEDMIIESSGEDLEACREGLRQGPHAGNVDVILYGVENVWGDEKMQEVQALIPQSSSWTAAQQAVLFELLTDKFTWSQPELAAQYAMQAVSLNPGSRVLIAAVDRWIQLGAKDKARRLLADAPESTWEKVPRFSGAKLWIDLGDPEAAAALLRGGKDDETRGNIMLARVLAETGDIEAAREIYRVAVLENEFVAYENRVEFFEFERRHGSREQAIAAYDQLRGAGFGADIVSRQRLSLLAAHPGAPWHWQEVWGLMLFLGALFIFALLPIVTIAPVHYRGLARRVGGLDPDRLAPVWTLRHAWYALGVFWVGGAISLFVFHPEALEMAFPWTKRTVATVSDIVLGNELLCATMLGLLLVVPLLRGRPVKLLLIGRWSIARSIFAGIGVAIGLKVLAAIIGFGIQSMGALGTDTIRAMQGAHQSFGLVAMLLIVAVAVPFLEELIFRGVLLEAFRGYVTFMLATIAQAATFAVIHESWADMPTLFIFGLLAGWLAKRSEGLLAPMAMHAAFNLSSALTIVGVTSMLNR